MPTPEPIAIIGMSCRFAGGVTSPEDFWELLSAGRDTIGQVPAERWQFYARQSPAHAAAVRDAPATGSFLDDIKGFDAEFFDVTPREATLMDPQQRIVLELAWEALEHAGVPPRELAGTDAAVFMGVGADDYGRRLLEDLPSIEAWTGIGSAYCAVANRVSYALDLRGPSVAVDTACSSSLVAIHLAAQALRAGECELALAGGVLVMAAPGLSLVLDAAGATSPDGRSKSFDATADGYGRGEGGGVVVLKLLRDAERDGDRVLAVVRGSAVRQDGRTNGIMAPDADAQMYLLRRAYAASGIDPATVDYVEAHGTGTRVGDPLEAAAMASVFGVGRGSPCLIGSVKPNIGHLEAGSGVAGVIKAVLALRHGTVPASLNVTRPNPAIDWDATGLRVATELTAWPDGPGPRRAGVSGFGYGGTIAHVILEQAPAPATIDPDAAHDDGVNLYPLSAATPQALAEQAGQLADRLVGDDASLAAVGHTLALRRSHLPERAAVMAGDRSELVTGLREVAAQARNAVTGQVLPYAGRGVVWVFSGHGSQWTGMGRELVAEHPVFAAVIDRLEPVFAAELGFSLRGLLAADQSQPVDVVQPMIFAVQVALGAAWRTAGVRPDAVIGHSVGEIAAAVTAGMLTLEEGARLVCRRSVLLRPAIGAGAMAMVNIAPDEAQRRLGARDDVVVAIAASPGWTVVSGAPAAVAELREQWRADGFAVRMVDSDVAFHGPQMDPLLDKLAAAAHDLAPRQPRIRVYSTAMEDPRSTTARDGAYWARNLRDQVRLAGAVTAAAEDGYRLFVEISAHPVVAHSVEDTLASLGIRDAYVGISLRRGRPELRSLLSSAAQLYCHGAEVDWAALWPRRELADLPGTAWQHKPYWVDEPAQRPAVTTHDPLSHTLLGQQVSVRGTSVVEAWSTVVDLASRPYPGRHPVRGVEIVPAAVLLETFFAAASARRAWPDLTDVALRVPVSLAQRRDLQVSLQDSALRLSSRIAGDHDDDRGWLTHTTATVVTHAGLPDAADTVEAEELLAPEYVVDRLSTLGVAAMGFAWNVRSLRRGPDVLSAAVDLDGGSYGPHRWAPILDAALSIASVVFPGAAVLRMPAHLERITLASSAPRSARVTVHRTGAEMVDIDITDTAGAPVARLKQLRYGRMETGEQDATLVYTLGWRPAAAAAPHEQDRSELVVLGPPSPLRTRLAAALGSPVLDSPEGLRAPATVVVVPPPVAEDAAWLLARTAGHPAVTRLWAITEGVLEAHAATAVDQGALWGLGRIIGGEQPGLWGGVVDIGADPADADAVAEVLRTIRGEDVVAVRGGVASVPRLRARAGSMAVSDQHCDPGATYLVTGGLGVLGLEVARWLAGRGARRLVLAGRDGLPPRERWDEVSDPGVRARIDAVVALERLGVTVRPLALDIADAAAARRLLDPSALGLPAIRGIVHAAGVLDNRLLRDLDEVSLRTVMRPKVSGARVLHTLFPPGSVDFFVMFSSAGQLLGLPGQASYATANAYLDTLAAHRRAAGDRGSLAIGWTSWRGLGMSTSSEAIDLELAAHGTADITAAEAFDAWERLTGGDDAYAAVLRVLPPSAGEPPRTPLLRELATVAVVRTAPAHADAPWVALKGAERHAALVDAVTRRVAEESGLSAADIDSHRPLTEMGLDSLMTTRVRHRLQQDFSVALPATLLWDQPTVDGIAAYAGALLPAAPDAAEGDS
ncbi:type I polyketide synthase [Actinoplanes auranticolor]|uniref:Polyketide synthase n=1 Tax=Actinoplanes auranticolor TaxID=47988 RepID=A0A919VQ24_9ACTN|nr:type I polyketide synthase [Actinoplanes auranticolor]GIM74454.1 polyketide synthase [Actinoplanes auranticolor]